MQEPWEHQGRATLYVWKNLLFKPYWKPVLENILEKAPLLLFKFWQKQGFKPVPTAFWHLTCTWGERFGHTLGEASHCYKPESLIRTNIILCLRHNFNRIFYNYLVQFRWIKSDSIQFLPFIVMLSILST